jgi:hypothetical protein
LDALRLSSFPGGARHLLGRLLGRRRKEPDLALISLAASAIREYAGKHAPLFERAERLREKADRLERAGIPSESAANRAERARKEVEAGLLAVGGSAAELAFDHEVERLYPTLGVQGH